MAWLALLAALASLGVSVGFSLKQRHQLQKLVLALEEEKRENDELKTTLVEVLDMEGNIRGQLALPGKPIAEKVSNRLAIAEKSVSTIQDEIRKQTKQLKEEVEQASADLLEAKGALEAARSREENLEKTLAEVVDGDGEVLVRLRLPGEVQRPPNKTPCGDMCKLAFFKSWQERDRHGYTVKKQGWKCVAGQGRNCDDVRKQFEDADGQCVLFERDDDC
jgi:MoxR-like ATPase